jgi:hypothetical protein
MRAVAVLATALLAAAAAGCGVEAPPEELTAVPLQRHATAPPAPPPAPAADLPPIPPRDAEVPDVRPTWPSADPPADGDEAPPSPPPTDPADEEAPDAAAGDADGAEQAPDAHDPPAPGPGTDAGTDPGAPDDDGAAGDVGDRGHPAGPSDSDLSRFVADRSDDAVASSHHVADLTGNGVRDVLVGRRSIDGRVELIVGIWDGRAVTASGHAEHRGSTGLGTLVVGDLDRDGRPEVLLPFVDRPRRGVLLATVTPSGELVVPAGCPVSEPSPHTLDFGTGGKGVWLACAQSEVRGSDGLVWGDGVFAGAMPGGGRK